MFILGNLAALLYALLLVQMLQTESPSHEPSCIQFTEPGLEAIFSLPPVCYPLPLVTTSTSGWFMGFGAHLKQQGKMLDVVLCFLSLQTNLSFLWQSPRLCQHWPLHPVVGLGFQLYVSHLSHVRKPQDLRREPIMMCIVPTLGHVWSTRINAAAAWVPFCLMPVPGLFKYAFCHNRLTIPQPWDNHPIVSHALGISVFQT